MFAGLNGHFLKNRFDTMADPGRRVWVTEMDIQPYGLEKYGTIDMDFKAEDLEDFMRQEGIPERRTYANAGEPGNKRTNANVVRRSLNSGLLSFEN